MAEEVADSRVARTLVHKAARQLSWDDGEREG
jgi:hypothetical protein